MLGAIIGDLAAYTYEHNKEVFYKQLISDDAKLSGIGLSVLSMYHLMNEHKTDCTWKELKETVKSTFSKCSDKSKDLIPMWEEWLSKEPGIPEEVKRAMNIAADVIGGWFERPRFTASAWGIRFHGTKDEMYLTELAEKIYRLRHGETKKDVIGELHINYANINTKYILPCTYMALAEDCLLRGFDFTSAMHNAMRVPIGDKHKLGAITGAMAEAMYGCEYVLLKKKYDNNISKGLCFPASIRQDFAVEFNDIYEYREAQRLFYPKNNATTNVERHIWKGTSNPFANKVISVNLRDQILKAARPSWDSRYGLYLDDGWIYNYRSNVLLFRFHLTMANDGTYRITNLQRSEAPQADDFCGMFEALDFIESEFLFSQKKQMASLSTLFYYKGENECPENWKDKTEEKFWHGEMMFYTNQIDMKVWKGYADSTLNNLKGKELECAQRYTSDEFTILNYIAELYQKWCPGESINWIWGYRQYKNPFLRNDEKYQSLADFYVRKESYFCALYLGVWDNKLVYRPIKRTSMKLAEGFPHLLILDNNYKEWICGPETFQIMDSIPKRDLYARGRRIFKKMEERVFVNDRSAPDWNYIRNIVQACNCYSYDTPIPKNDMYLYLQLAEKYDCKIRISIDQTTTIRTDGWESYIQLIKKRK